MASRSLVLAVLLLTIPPTAAGSQSGTWSPNSLQERIYDDPEMERYVTLLLRLRVQDWSPSTIKNAQPSVLELTALILEQGLPEFWVRLLPEGMHLDQFHLMILREMNRRGAFEGYFLKGVISPISDGRAIAVAAERNMQREVEIFGRDVTMGTQTPLIGETEERSTTRAMRAAIYQSGVVNILFERNMQLNTRTNLPQLPDFFLGPEIVRALGLPSLDSSRLNYGRRLNSNLARLTLGYALGSLAEFNPATPNATLTVSSRPDPVNGRALTWGEVQPSFCRQIQAIYVQGNKLNPRDAVHLGLLQARVDARFQENSDPTYGLTGPCPRQ